jgi:C-terminal processing protease CtpA/Prc
MKVGDKIVSVGGQEVADELDPLELPEVFADAHGAPVEVEISREVQGSEPVTKVLTVTPDPSADWRELPGSLHAPVSITSIGAAFHLLPSVHSLDPKGPAAQAGIETKDSIDPWNWCSATTSPTRAPIARRT